MTKDQRELTTEVTSNRNSVAKTENLRMRGEKEGYNEAIVSKCLYMIGMPVHLIGYHYTMQAVVDLMDTLVSREGIYSKLARYNDSDPKSVENAISNAIRITWKRKNMKIAEAVFGTELARRSRKPTNTSFMGLLSIYIENNGISSLEEMTISYVEEEKNTINDERETERSAISSTEKLIEKYLKLIGIPNKNKTYNYFKEAVTMYLNGEVKSTVEIYKKVAKQYGAKAIESTMHKQLRDVRDWQKKLESIFGYMVSENYVTPKNEEFIALIAERINMDMQIADDKKKEEHAVIQYLHMFAIPVYCSGYKYLIEAIMMCKEKIFLSPTKEIYPYIAKKYKTTPTSVERLIRYAIKTGWNWNRMDVVERIFAYTISSDKGLPTSSEFIKMIACRIKANEE